MFAERKHQDLDLEKFNQMIKKAIDAKAKSTFQACFSTKKIDQNCSCSYWPANSTVAKNQSSTIKNPQVEEPKPQSPKSSVSQCSNNNESPEKTWKKKRKKSIKEAKSVKKTLSWLPD